MIVNVTLVSSSKKAAVASPTRSSWVVRAWVKSDDRLREKVSQSARAMARYNLRRKTITKSIKNLDWKVDCQRVIRASAVLKTTKVPSTVSNVGRKPTVAKAVDTNSASWPTEPCWTSRPTNCIRGINNNT